MAIDLEEAVARMRRLESAVAEVAELPWDELPIETITSMLAAVESAERTLPTVGYGIVRLIDWAIPRFGITGWLAGLIGLVMVAAYGVLMFGGCLATYGLAQQVTR